MKSKNYIFISFGHLTLLCCFVLFLFLSFVANNTDKRVQDAHERTTIQQLEASLDKVIAKTSKESYVHNKFTKLAQVFKNSKQIDDEVVSALQATDKSMDFSGWFYVDKNLIFNHNATEERNNVFETIIEALKSEPEEFAKAQRDLSEGLINIFGAGNRLELVVSRKNMTSSFITEHGRQFYYWNSFKNGTAVFFVSNVIPDFICRFDKYYKQSDRFSAGDLRKGRWSNSSLINTQKLRSAHKKASLEESNSTHFLDHLWVFLENNQGNVWCKTVPRSEVIATRQLRYLYIYYIAVFLCVISIINYAAALFHINPGDALCRYLDSISLIYRIYGIFVMASFFPLLISILIGVSIIADRTEIIENQVISESLISIQGLENAHRESIQRAQKCVQDIRNALKNEPATEELFFKHLSKHSLPAYLARLELRDINANIMFTLDDPEVHGVTAAMDVFCRLAMRRHLSERLGDSIARVTPAEIVSEAIVSTDEMGMATIMRRPGELVQFKMGHFAALWYWDVYPELKEGPAFISIAFQMIAIHRKYLKQRLANISLESSSILLSTEMNDKHSDFTIYPEIKSIDNEDLIDVAVTSINTRKMVSRNITIDEQEYWLTVKPDMNLASHVYFSLVSKADRLDALKPLKIRLALSSIFALLVSLTGAALLSHLIIKPVGDIFDGVNAIRRKDHKFRIAVRREDELGEISRAFNTVIEDFKNLEYGRVIQESLLPHKVTSPEGYDLACFNASATDLAGDYHDVLELDDGRIAIILGDVTGHGISAALAMAMAKASVNYAQNRGELFPSAVMDSLNKLFNKELKPKNKFMTFVTVVLDLQKSCIDIENAGQSYPLFFVSSKQKIEELQMPSLPLGPMKKRRSKPQCLQMQSGDGILLYSDGIVECNNEEGEMFGYKRLQLLFEKLMQDCKSSQKILASLMSSLNEFREPGAYPDDVTLVLLRKK